MMNTINHNEVKSAIVGHFDGVFGRLAVGWAFFPSDPNRIITVEIICDNRIVGTADASLYREDLEAQSIGTGYHQFKCTLPIELFDGKGRKVEARIMGRAEKLPGGPHQINQKLATLNDAFDTTSLNASAPLSDFQVTMLRGLTTACETLSEHTRLLQRISLGSSVRTDYLRLENQSNEINIARNCVYADEFRKLDSKQDVIIFSIIDWNFRTQRPQHLAANFAKMGKRVIYISVHLEPIQHSDQKFYIRSKPNQGVYEVVLRCSGSVPSVYSGFTDEQHVRDLCQGINEMVEQLGVKGPTVILQYPTWLPIAQSIQGATVVFDCLDHLAGFNTASPEVIALEHELVEKADLVVTSSQYLCDAVGRPAPIVRNAAEIEFFGTEPLQVENYGKNPIIGYYGAISEWFDVELVYYAAEKRPDWTFILIGSTVGASIGKLEKLKNVKFLGEIPYVKIPNHLYAFDCCIIPFKLSELIKATNPVKVYEYFAAGKPVVSTDIPELRLLPQEYLSLASTKKDFVDKIEKALKPNSQLEDQRRLWVSHHSWFSRSRDFLKYVDESKPLISVVVLCYNNVEMTKACLLSLDTHSNYSNLEIICVDNNSTDGTADFLQQWKQRSFRNKVVSNSENLGFAEGNNKGILVADGEYVILLNNDTYVTPGWAHDLIRPLVQNKSIGMTGPLTNMIGNEQKINIHYSNMEEMILASRNFTMSRRRDLFKTNNLAFFCVAISRTTIDKVGLLDKQFGLGYFEDDDYCQRVMAAGYELAVVDGVFVHHHLSASFDKDPDARARLIATNKRKYEAKWGKWHPHKYREAPGFGE